MNGFLVALVVASTPLLFATIGEIITERAGLLNLGVEGMMLIGAVAGFGVGYLTDSPVLAVLAAAFAGGLSGLLFGFLTISLRANQVVSGLTLTIFGSGLSSFIGSSFIGFKMSDSFIDSFKPYPIPLLSRIPIIGQVIFTQDIYVYIGLITAILLGLYLYRTRIGLNLVAVGENPSAADASGINVDLYKYLHVTLGGALCGLGGAYLSMVDVPQWQDNITAGRGWIAIALVIFVGWNPVKAIFGAFLFGGLSIIGFRLQQYGIPQSLLDTLPYLVTILVLVMSSMRKSKDNDPPKGLSIPYFREER